MTSGMVGVTLDNEPGKTHEEQVHMAVKVCSLSQMSAAYKLLNRILERALLAACPGIRDARRMHLPR